MIAQLDLSLSPPARPLARASDPITSHIAGEEHVLSGRWRGDAERVLEALRYWPGRTSRELAERSGLDRYLVARRLPDLKETGHVERGEKRQCAIGRCLALTWVPKALEGTER